MTWRRSWNLRILEGIVRSMKPVQIFMSLQSNWEIILPYCSLGTSRKNKRQLLFLLSKEPIDVKTPFAPTEPRGFDSGENWRTHESVEERLGKTGFAKVKNKGGMISELWKLGLMLINGPERWKEIWWNCYIWLLVQRPWKCWKVPVAERALDATRSQGIGLK